MKITNRLIFLVAILILAGIAAGALYKGINGAVLVSIVGGVTAIASYFGARRGAQEGMKNNAR